MKHFLTKGFLLCVTCFFVACASGTVTDSENETDASTGTGASPSISKPLISSDGRAIALASGEVSGASQSAAMNTAQAKSWVASSDVSNSILMYVANAAMDDLYGRAPKDIAAKAVSYTYASNVTTIKFEDEKYSEGGGTVTLNGELVDTASSQVKGVLKGNLTADIQNVTEKVTVDSVDYSETVSGKMALEFSAAYDWIVDQNNAYILLLDLDVNESGEDITVTGTAEGTIKKYNASVKMDMEMENDEPVVTFTCDGSISVETSTNGVETCTVKSDCSDCEL